MSFAEDVKAVHSLLRTFVGAALIVALGYGGGWIYTNFSPNVQLRATKAELVRAREALTVAQTQAVQQAERINELDQSLQVSQQQLEHMEISLQLLKVDRRVADIIVARQEHDNASGGTVTEFQFRELDADGIPLGEAQRFRIIGDLVYLDFWVVKFNDHYVEQADLDRSASICLFRRLFGEYQEPVDGYTIDTVGARPLVYGGPAAMSSFEQQIWHDFWNIALDPHRAADLGIRAAHGEAVSVKLRPGKRYRVTLRASDGLSVAPPEELLHAGVAPNI